MSKKSAAKLKLVEANKITEEEVREHFQEYLNVEKEMLKAKIIQAKRIDALTDIIQAFKDFYGVDGNGVRLCECKRLQHHGVEIYEQLLKRVENFTFEQFNVEGMEDPYIDLIPTADDCETMEQILEAYITFIFIRPFGERILQVNRKVLEDMASIQAETTSEDE